MIDCYCSGASLIIIYIKQEIMYYASIGDWYKYIYKYIFFSFSFIIIIIIKNIVVYIWEQESVP